MPSCLEAAATHVVVLLPLTCPLSVCALLVFRVVLLPPPAARSFWLEVGRTLRACDSASRMKKGGNKDKAATTNNDNDEDAVERLLADHHDDSDWLRFLVFRKGSATPPPPPPPLTSAGRGKRPVGRPKASTGSKKGTLAGGAGRGATGHKEEVGACVSLLLRIDRVTSNKTPASRAAKNREPVLKPLCRKGRQW